MQCYALSQGSARLRVTSVKGAWATQGKPKSQSSTRLISKKCKAQSKTVQVARVGSPRCIVEAVLGAKSRQG